MSRLCTEWLRGRGQGPGAGQGERNSALPYEQTVSVGSLRCIQQAARSGSGQVPAWLPTATGGCRRYNTSTVFNRSARLQECKEEFIYIFI